MKPRESVTEYQPVIRWLLHGDPAIRWQVYRDLLSSDQRLWEEERARIPMEGWGARLLAQQSPDGTFGGGLYGPKWTSTTYTMLLLMRLGLPRGTPQVQKSCRVLLEKGLYRDGGINYFQSMTCSETCVTGMILSIVSYFELPDPRIDRLVEYLLTEQMADGGWNCLKYRGAVHGSFHTTINVLEGLQQYIQLKGDRGRKIGSSIARAVEFLLQHRLFRSHRTGKIVNGQITRFSFPPRWHYDVLRSLDFLRRAGISYDPRMNDGLDLIKKRQKKNGRWLLQNRYPGKVFFDMEKPGKPSRWNTLRALRVLKHYQPGK